MGEFCAQWEGRSRAGEELVPSKERGVRRTPQFEARKLQVSKGNAHLNCPLGGSIVEITSGPWESIRDPGIDLQNICDKISPKDV